MGGMSRSMLCHSADFVEGPLAFRKKDCPIGKALSKVC